MEPKTEPWGTPQDKGNMKDEEEPEVTEKDQLKRLDLLSQLWEEPMIPKLELSDTIEENAVVNCVECITEVEREEWRAHYQLHGR